MARQIGVRGLKREGDRKIWEGGRERDWGLGF